MKDLPSRLPRRIIDAESWIFDLDNTLYHPRHALYRQIDERMRSYIAHHLDLSLDDAHHLQKNYFREFGTSLRGLMDRHGFDPEPFLDHVHDIDLSGLPPDADLAAVLARLPGRKVVYTNGSLGHALRVTERLGIREHFDGIFGIAEAQYRPKPEPGAYRKLVADFGLDPARSVMVEDMARNLVPAAALGMATVWVTNGGERCPHDAIADGEAPAVDAVVDDLLAWLAALVGSLDSGDAVA